MRKGSEIFGELRSIFSNEDLSLEDRWVGVLDILAPYHSETALLEHEIVPYVLEHIAHDEGRLFKARSLAQLPLLLSPIALLIPSLDITHKDLPSRVLTSPYLTNVKKLNLSHLNLHLSDVNPITTGRFPQLEDLNLWGNWVGPKGAEALANSPHLKKLTHLELGSNLISSMGVEYLCSSSNFENLLHLGLSANMIDPQGIAFLAQCSTFQKLTYLDLHDNAIMDEGAAILAASPYLKNLEDFYLGECWVSAEGYKKLMEAGFPDGDT